MDTGVGRIEVFSKYPATFPPDIPIGKHDKDKIPAAPIMMTVSLPTSTCDMKDLQFMEHGKVWPNSSKEGSPKICLGNGLSNLPARVVNGSFFKKVGSDFVRVQNNHRCA